MSMESEAKVSVYYVEEFKDSSKHLVLYHFQYPKKSQCFGYAAALSYLEGLKIFPQDLVHGFVLSMH